MKYVITLNDKKYEVDVTETDAVITGVFPVSSLRKISPISGREVSRPKSALMTSFPPGFRRYSAFPFPVLLPERRRLRSALCPRPVSCRILPAGSPGR